MLINDDIYFNYSDGIYTVSTTNSTISTNQFSPGFYYGLGYYNNTLYALDAGDYTNAGQVHKIDLNGNHIGMITTGVVPTDFKVVE